MKTTLFGIFIVFFVQTLPAQVPITEGGKLAGQEALRNQNALNPETKALDRQFQLQKLQHEAEQATRDVTAEQKSQQFNLGADILPFVIPHISKLAGECIKQIDMKAEDASAKYSNCTKTAVQKFQVDPAGFINSLPQADREKLEALVKQKVQESIRKPAQVEP